MPIPSFFPSTILPSLLAYVYFVAGIDVDVARSEEETMMLNDANEWLDTMMVKDKKHPKTGATPLHVAAAKGYLKVME